MLAGTIMTPEFSINVWQQREADLYEVRKHMSNELTDGSEVRLCFSLTAPFRLNSISINTLMDLL